MEKLSGMTKLMQAYLTLPLFIIFGGLFDTN